jgi:hypothetical protein
MRRNRDTLGGDICNGKSFRFVEQALLLDRDILWALLGGSAEDLTLQPPIFLLEEAHPVGQIREFFRQVGSFYASRDLIATAAKSSRLVNNKFTASCGFMRHTSYPSSNQFNCPPVSVTLSTSNRWGQWNSWRSSSFVPDHEAVLLPQQRVSVMRKPEHARFSTAAGGSRQARKSAEVSDGTRIDRQERVGLE